MCKLTLLPPTATHRVLLVDEDVDVSMMALGKVPKEIGGVTWAALAGEERKAAKQTFK